MRRRLVIWLVAMLTATALAAVQATPVAAAPTSPAVVAQLPSVVAGTLYLTQHDGAIYEPNGTGGARRIDAARWRDVYAYQSPVAAPTDYVKYPWSSTVYAVTFWSNDSTTWLWQALPLAQWQRAGSPAPRIAGHIAGSTYHRWATSPELFVRGADGVTRKLSFTEWQASGPQPYETRADRGYQKLTWAPSIASMSSISAGQGAAISYAAWAGEDFPSPQQVQRFPGDQFTKDACSDVVVYAGPTMNRAVTFQEYVAAGAPQVRVVNTGPCAPPTVSALAPASGSSAGGTEVVVTGTLLENVTAVTFGSVPARSFTVESPTRLRAVSPTGTAGPVAVRVTTSAGTSAVVSTSTFTYTAPAPSPPAVSSLAPSSGPSVGGTEVVVTGTSFANVTAVSFGSAPARSFTVESGTQLRAVSPTGTAGPVAVRVTTSAGTSAVVSTSTFTYT
ncbi:IPT/TIG domain-containing protein, partial [Aeromicrobium sp. Leaf350]|uniref:IPT/TIG domain-containing protein n=1 Tax=Aeromicrobium sp. Leaf350 TaxID=2876565 RepID=UPI001E5966A1